MRALLILSLVAVPVLPACFGFNPFAAFDDGGDDDDDGVDDDDVDDDDFDLVIDDASASRNINGSAPQPGEVFIILRVTMTNPASEDPVSTSPSLFSLENEGGVIVTNALSFTSVDGCEEGVSVAGGGSVSCSVVFENDATAVPTVLRYESLDGFVNADVDVPAFEIPVAPTCTPNVNAGTTQCENDCISTNCEDEQSALINTCSCAFDCFNQSPPDPCGCIGDLCGEECGLLAVTMFDCSDSCVDSCGGAPP